MEPFFGILIDGIAYIVCDSTSEVYTEAVKTLNEHGYKEIIAVRTKSDIPNLKEHLERVESLKKEFPPMILKNYRMEVPGLHLDMRYNGNEGRRQNFKTMAKNTNYRKK